MQQVFVKNSELFTIQLAITAQKGALISLVEFGNRHPFQHGIRSVLIHQDSFKHRAELFLIQGVIAIHCEVGEGGGVCTLWG